MGSMGHRACGFRGRASEVLLSGINMVGEVWGTLCQVKGANEAVWGEALPSTARTPAGTWLGKGAPEVPVPPLHGRIRPCPFSVPFPDGTQMLSSLPFTAEAHGPNQPAGLDPPGCAAPAPRLQKQGGN